MILVLRSQKKTMEEIAEELGTTEGIVSAICRKNGVGGKVRYGGGYDRVPKEKRDALAAQNRARAELEYKARIEAFGFKYVGGYENSDGYLNVMCPVCRSVFSYSCITIRMTKTTGMICKNCEDMKRAAAKAEADKAKAEQRAKRQSEQQKKAEEAEVAREAKRHRVCKECGAVFISSSGVYCSEKCKRRSDNRRREARRRGYKQKIPLTKLYSRDNGICYICGCSCDFDDYEIIDGAFVVGPSYPTVEHVIPLCRGGDDSWENVKLACHKCNSAKSRKSLYQVKSSGQIAWAI